ncbi:hypothetical protein [Paraburkholderia ferrariae]|uniref:hypothetical protein n=1 Tax=Paraburkholderia ferrariae TaxID=386056 RepID=UPI0014708671|nr:hypothetical protein [Paraburkholderia ferrariae]
MSSRYRRVVAALPSIRVWRLARGVSPVAVKARGHAVGQMRERDRAGGEVGGVITQCGIEAPVPAPGPK